MRRTLTTGVLLLALTASLPVPGALAATASLDTLAWLAGSWASDSAGVRVEEHWTAPGGGLMVGMHRDIARGRAVGFEFLRIVGDTSGIAYLSSPGGRPVTRFALRSVGPRSATFENPEHDFPQRILYWLDAQGRLHARIEGTLDGRPAGESWCWAPDRLTAR